MAYPYSAETYQYHGEIERHKLTIACTAVTADGLEAVNVYPGEHCIEMIVGGVASVSALEARIYAYTDSAQTAAKAKQLHMLEIGAVTSATVLTLATSSVAPTAYVHVLPFTNAYGETEIAAPFGLLVSLLVSSVTTTTGSAEVLLVATPK
jgi:hypothetical protein